MLKFKDFIKEGFDENWRKMRQSNTLFKDYTKPMSNIQPPLKTQMDSPYKPSYDDNREADTLYTRTGEPINLPGHIGQPRAAQQKFNPAGVAPAKDFQAINHQLSKNLEPTWPFDYGHSGHTLNYRTFDPWNNPKDRGLSRTTLEMRPKQNAADLSNEYQRAFGRNKTRLVPPVNSYEPMVGYQSYTGGTAGEQGSEGTQSGQRVNKEVKEVDKN